MLQSDMQKVSFEQWKKIFTLSIEFVVDPHS
jgi:hypothetical protein